jgi:hypothetical protein
MTNLAITANGLRKSARWQQPSDEDRLGVQFLNASARVGTWSMCESGWLSGCVGVGS